MNLVDERPISRFVFDPSTSLFKQSKSEPATCETIWCKLENCPLAEAGTCMWKPVLGWTRCPYGRIQAEKGPTRRSSKFYSWIREKKAQYPDVPNLGYPAMKMAFIGEYVYLPYSHMDMNEEVPFLARSGVFAHGQCLIPQEHWTLDTVLKILDFRPQALMGGEIVSYQQKEIPLFLMHLREYDMWESLIAARPELNTAPNYVGRKALLRTLTYPITWTARSSQNEYPVIWTWDGKRVSTTSKDAYSSTWGQIKLDSLELRGVPAHDTTIVVQQNEWVANDTVFVD